jgi:hypothetical protein
MEKSAALFRASNLVAMDYPLTAALASALQICDQAVVVIGPCFDETCDLVHDLQAEHGHSRVLIRGQLWKFDRTWQERVWDWGAEMVPDAEWLMYHDADEAICESSVPAIHTAMADPDIWLISFPYVHHYCTPDYEHLAPFYPRNTRLGRRSRGYRMRNWCSDETPNHAVCQMVYGDDERNAHACRDEHVALLETPIHHYGWCRNGHAMALSNVKHRAWYADGDGWEDGHLEEMERPYDFKLQEKLTAGQVVQYDGPHPAVMADWFAAHEEEWEGIDG